MGVTKKELAETLGVAKQTVVNYIDRLGLAPDHVTRRGKYDVLDDFAASAIADAVGKSIPVKPSSTGTADVVPDTVLAALNGRIDDLKEQNKDLREQNSRLADELAELRLSRDHEVEELRRQLDDANDRAAGLADRVAGIAERQQALAATPWWRRGRMAMRLLGPGSDE